MLNKKELIILSLLRRNSREKLTKLSKETKIPVSTLFEKIKYYEGAVIKRHTAILDFTKLGYGARATILIKLKEKDQIEKFLLNSKVINTCLKINNGYDFMMEAVFRDIGELELFTENLEKKFTIEQKQVYYITSDLKREDFLSHPDYLKLTG